MKKIERNSGKNREKVRENQEKKKWGNFEKIALEKKKKISLLSLSREKPYTKKPHHLFIVVVFVGKVLGWVWFLNN